MIIKRQIIIIAVLLGLAASVGIWLFRIRTDNDDPRGIVRYRWKWGLASEILIDRDRDGRFDLKVIYPGRFREFASDDSPHELWADQNFDGRFDVMWRVEGGLVVRQDIDGDGVFETEVRGTEAERFRAELTLFK
jgi:hypothetical protein